LDRTAPLLHLPQRQRTQHRPHRLQRAAQQLADLLALDSRKLNA
jgi:hypothetical protein